MVICNIKFFLEDPRPWTSLECFSQTSGAISTRLLQQNSKLTSLNFLNIRALSILWNDIQVHQIATFVNNLIEISTLLFNHRTRCRTEFLLIAVLFQVIAGILRPTIILLSVQKYFFLDKKVSKLSTLLIQEGRVASEKLKNWLDFLGNLGLAAYTSDRHRKI